MSIVHDDPAEAGLEVAEELLEALGAEPQLLIAFVSTRMDPAPALAALNRELPGAKVVGCSSYAEINSEEALSGSLTVMGLRFEGVAFETFSHTDVASGPFEAGAAFARKVEGFEPTLLMVFPDGLAYNGTRLLQGMQSVLGERFPIVGGLAADDAKFEQTHQLHDARCLTGAVVGVALRGDIRVATAARAGWRPVGATRTVTKVDGGNVLLELDGQPALPILREYIGERWSEMPMVGVEFPLGVVGGNLGSQRLAEQEDIVMLRAVKAIDEARGAIIFGGDIPEGAKVRLSRGTTDDVIAGADAACEAALAELPDPSIALFFDCMARKVLLGPRYKNEVMGSMTRLGASVPKVGFHTFGEFSPINGVTMHHDETYTLALIKG